MSDTTLNPPVGPEDHFVGPADAPVELVEYGDYECPKSARAHAVLEEVCRLVGGQVRYVFRNFPLTEVHANAAAAAEAAEAVAAHGGNDAFWDMHDILFENQDALDVDDLLGYAEACGVDPAAVADDLSSGAQRERVRCDFTSGVRSGVNGTPAFFVNGTRYDGNWADPASFASDLLHATRGVR